MGLIEVEAEDLDFLRRYGPWEPFTLVQAKEQFDPLGIPWWVAGGLAAEAFSGVQRAHEDIDISVFRKHVPVLREAFDGRYHLWSAGSGSLRPISDRFPEPAEDADQLWMREHALAPWRADIVLNPDDDGRWVSRRDPTFVAALDEVTWERDGVRFLNPEIVLCFKAKFVRPKDEHDFAAIVPRLDAGRRAWLADYLRRCEPGHPWLARL